MSSTKYKKLTLDYGRFFAVGVVTLGIDLAAYAFLTRSLGLYYLLARTISLLLAVLWSYAANRRWTFRTSHAFYSGALLRYLVVNGVSVAGNLLLFRLLVESVGMPDLLSVVVSSGVVSVGSFIANRLWTFRTS